MKLLRRWLSLRYRLRTRRWRQRALAAEALLADARAQLEVEMWRNREREDTFVSATVMGSRQMYGVPPRSAPAMKQVNRPMPALTASGVDADGFTWADRQEFEMYWKTDADAVGVPIQEAKRKFYEEVIIPRRTPLNDDPYSTN